MKRIGELTSRDADFLVSIAIPPVIPAQTEPLISGKMVGYFCQQLRGPQIAHSFIIAIPGKQHIRISSPPRDHVARPIEERPLQNEARADRAERCRSGNPLAPPVAQSDIENSANAAAVIGWDAARDDLKIPEGINVESAQNAAEVQGIIDSRSLEEILVLIRRRPANVHPPRYSLRCREGRAASLNCDFGQHQFLRR